jgi:hypothetical protein
MLAAERPSAHNTGNALSQGPVVLRGFAGTIIRRVALVPAGNPKREIRNKLQQRKTEIQSPDLGDGAERIEPWYLEFWICLGFRISVVGDDMGMKTG